jgi:hypothetical protein
MEPSMIHRYCVDTGMCFSFSFMSEQKQKEINNDNGWGCIDNIRMAETLYMYKVDLPV